MDLTIDVSSTHQPLRNALQRHAYTLEAVAVIRGGKGKRGSSPHCNALHYCSGNTVGCTNLSYEREPWMQGEGWHREEREQPEAPPPEQSSTGRTRKKVS